MVPSIHIVSHRWRRPDIWLSKANFIPTFADRVRGLSRIIDSTLAGPAKAVPLDIGLKHRNHFSGFLKLQPSALSIDLWWQASVFDNHWGCNMYSYLWVCSPGCRHSCFARPSNVVWRGLQCWYQISFNMPHICPSNACSHVGLSITNGYRNVRTAIWMKGPRPVGGEYNIGIWCLILQEI